MPKLLIISTTFPPFNNVGAARLGCFAKYLTQQGWEVVSVTLKHADSRSDNSIVPDMPDIPTEYFQDYSTNNIVSDTIRKVERKTRIEYFTYGLSPNIIYLDGKRAVRKIMSDHPDVDLILASFVRPIAIRLASWAHRKYHIPWIADYRDTVEMIDFKWKERYMLQSEKMVVSSAAFLTTTSRILEKQLGSRHKQPIHIVRNGYDPHIYQELKPVGFDRFTIVYTGSLLPGRSPVLFYHAISDLISENLISEHEIQVVHYGVTNFRIDQRYLASLLKRITYRSVLVYRDRVSHLESIESQLGAHMLLLLPGLVSKHGGNVPAKLFEYLRARRPILSVASSPQDEVAEIIDRCNAGLATHDPEQIKDYVLSCYQAWKNEHPFPHENHTADLTEYSREYQTTRLRELMEAFLADNP